MKTKFNLSKYQWVLIKIIQIIKQEINVIDQWEINVTPFVDVMLVLLIIFMITAPLLTVGVPVDLPKTKAGQVNADSAPLVVTIQNDGKLFLQDNNVNHQN